MKGDLIINEKDAFETWGISMGEGFLNALLNPPPLKPFIENKSRLEDGKEVIANSPRYDERDLTLMFYIKAKNRIDYRRYYTTFLEELKRGKIRIMVPSFDASTYNLTPLSSQLFSMNVPRTFSRLSIKFNEPNPGIRY